MTDIRNYWFMYTNQACYMLDDETAEEIDQWLNNARVEDQYTTRKITDFITGEIAYVVLDSISSIAYSTPETRQKVREHNKRLEIEIKEFNGYDES